MKNKGFTLVEIIVIILVIGIISVIAIPNLLIMKKKLNEKAYNNKIGTLQVAAESYALSNKNKLVNACKDGTINCTNCGDNCYETHLTVEQLISAGLYEEEKGTCKVLNNKDNTCVEDETSFDISLKGNDYNTIKAETVNISMIKVNAVKFVKKLAEGADENSIGTITAPIDGNPTCTNTLAYDGTEENNLRYVGSNPCNYVTFNGEKAGWRIVGVMNKVDDGTGKLESRIKMVRRSSLGNFAWNANGEETGNSPNDWTVSKLKDELNTDFLNYNETLTTPWYTNWNTGKERSFSHSNALKPDSQNYIKNAVWYLGTSNSNNILVDAFYEKERGPNKFEGRADHWVGLIGLLYPSDSGYAVGDTVGGEQTREDCINDIILFERRNYSCKSNYLGMSSSNGWAITPSTSDSGYGPRSLFRYEGSIITSNFSQYAAVTPAFYLKASVMIKNGDGSQENPFELSLN